MLTGTLIKDKLEWLIAGFFPIMTLFPNKAGFYFFLIACLILYMYLKKEIIFRWNRFGLLFTFFYLIYALGCVWTNHVPEALKYLEFKLSFLLMPILFSFRWTEDRQLNMVIILWGLIIGVVLSFILGLVIAVPCYNLNGSFPACFVKGYLSPIVHPTYMSVYATFSIAGLLVLFKIRRMKKYLFLFLFILIVCYLFLLMSLAGVLFFCLLIGVFLFLQLVKRYSFILSTILLTSGVISMTFLVLTIPYLKNDFSEAGKKLRDFVNEPLEFINQTSAIPTGTETRLILWYVSMEEICENPFGVGTANVDDHISENLISKGKVDLAAKLYNPHNQFMQTCLEIGPGGLIILFAICLGGIWRGLKKHNMLIVLLFSSLVINSLFESMLQQQAGIMFYTMMYFVFDWFPSVRSQVVIQ